MAILKKNKRSQGRATPPSTKKTVTKPKKSVTKPKKSVAKPKKPVASPKKVLAKAKKPIAKPKKVLESPKKPVASPKKALAKSTRATAGSAQASSKTAVAQPIAVAVVETTRVTLRKDVIPLALKPSAQTCPLVLDAIILEEDFSPRDCFSCDEFDCRFYAAEERSGPLKSLLFAGEEGDEDGDDWDLLAGEGEEPEGEGDWGSEEEL